MARMRGGRCPLPSRLAALRAALKSLLRRFGLRALSVELETQNEKGDQ
jgi:hypothetical protein